MTWNSTLRRYEDANGKPIDSAQIRQWVDEFISNSQAEIDNQSNQLLDGAITIAAFFAFLTGLLTSMHIASSLIAYGGENEMNNTRWGRVDEKVSSELAYLATFQEQVEESQVVTESLAAMVANTAETPELVSAIVDAIRTEGRSNILGTVSSVVDSAEVEISNLSPIVDSFSDRIGSIIWGEVESRSRSYPDSVFATYENSVKGRETDAGAIGVRRVSLDDAASCDDCPPLATDEYVSMDEITDIGDTACLANCRCWFEFEYLNVEPLEIDRGIYAAIYA